MARHRLLGLLACILSLAQGGPLWAQNWTTLEPGLELGHFAAPDSVAAGGGQIHVLRVDPSQWGFQLLCADSCGGRWKTARGWSEDYDLVAATNAGMFHHDGVHVGYLKGGCCGAAPRSKGYLSAFAFSPRRTGLPSARIFDLDEVPLDTVAARYRCVVQNLRLVKRPGENRWSQQPRRWSEMALGQDRRGRILLIFSRPALSMHDLNAWLLQLPLELVCAQHLEGGPEAQLFVGASGREFEWVGSYETGFTEHDRNAKAWAIPNVIGVVRR